MEPLPVREHRRAYLHLNIVYYGIMVAAMVYVAFDPALQKTSWDEVGKAFGTGPLRVVGASTAVVRSCWPQP